tara:strand:+ start:496 stop:645 length:150 start_codon:yes stop_codon:yes gene_type:complete
VPAGSRAITSLDTDTRVNQLRYYGNRRRPRNGEAAADWRHDTLEIFLVD